MVIIVIFAMKLMNKNITIKQIKETVSLTYAEAATVS